MSDAWGSSGPSGPVSSILLYQTEDQKTRIDVRLEEETVWLSQKVMADLFQKDVRTISEHIRNVFDEGELERESVIRNFRITASDGKEYDTQHYNLDVIISVGYRVKSLRGTQFRIWATQRLREYMVKGFTMDDDRLKRGGGGKYFDELLARIRDIRSSERVFWRKVLDIYATSVDYDPTTKASQLFFQIVQNKMHWAIHGQTAAEVIHSRADAAKPQMGLTSWAGDRPRKTDIAIAKNYLNEDEIKALNLIVSAYLDFAELQALNRKPMHMQDWISKLDDFLRLTERQILTHAGKISHDQAVAKASAEFEVFRQSQASLPQPVDAHFDEAISKVKQLEPKKPRGKKRSGFTLTELLIVIAVIALLLALLLPILSRARQAAYSTACQANLRSIGQAMRLYADENRDAIPGSPVTTGRYIWLDDGANFTLASGISSTKNSGLCVDIYDFMGPLCRQMHITLPETDSTVERFRFYRQVKAFFCPANEGVIATKHQGPAAMEDGPMLSYCTATGFLLPAFRTAEYSGRAAMPGTPFWTVPSSYRPKVHMVGDSASKIYAADSGRWSRYDSTPTFALDPDADHNSTPFSDFGAFWGITKSYDRSVPNGMNEAVVDARIYAYRHGQRSPRGASGAYRMNAVFFDGHVDTLDDLASANPSLWLPRGAVIGNPSASLNSGPVVWPDVVQRYIPATPFVVP